MRQELHQALRLVESVIQAGMRTLSKNPSENGNFQEQEAHQLTEQLVPYHKQAETWYNQLSNCFKQHIGEPEILIHPSIPYSFGLSPYYCGRA